MLDGQRVGIIGLGRIGKEVAKRLHAFGVELVYHDGYRANQAEEQALHVTFLSTRRPAPDRRHPDPARLPRSRRTGWIGQREIGLMKDGAVFVNTCRGEVVDQDALYRALVSGKLAAAGLDVFVKEPGPARRPDSEAGQRDLDAARRDQQPRGDDREGACVLRQHATGHSRRATEKRRAAVRAVVSGNGTR